MPARLLIDTDVLVEYLRGRVKAGEWLESQDAADFVVSAITVAELFAGVKGVRETQVLDRFLLAVEVLPATEQIGRLAGQYRRDYGPRHGIGLADALIAATAALHYAALVTFNRRHFPMLTGVVVPYRRS
jgi:predicted nucleic acid-binding protein